ncbi:oxygen-dependent tRNA uridine(34) hydroxylase TrhO [Paucibacter sp. XJ19-41]|uniref:oxygen-dependent tRNA uridine(34) hydroxylase TrhO n=1 Tax=Paucibacter sp. XJ19-41 TaxID=2927824 RepID=UPI00234A7B12|nr:rhodanese-like domain-containing protein [Paucibacter sp. XJ19-41]MDC6167098.1 rhodanese-like domain-containing protein [Paucibacter sp. XJ19-41]
MPCTEIHSSFYRFVALSDPEGVAARLRELVAVGLGGNILVAAEGISGAVAGEPDVLQAFEAALQSDPLFGGAFAGLVFKHSACATRPFTLIKVHVKPEIVAFGVPGVSGLPAPERPDTHVAPARWRELLARPDVLVLDNRNSFEFKLGRFAGAIDPAVTHFRDFPAYVNEYAEAWKREGKTIAMYCTGGIRCEKTAAWMQDQGLQVYQLDGGILNYFQSMPEPEADWQGECFVFDKRIAIDTRLQETATSAEQVYAEEPPWRLARAKRLDPDG